MHVTLDMSTFPKAKCVMDSFQTQKLACDAVKIIRIARPWGALQENGICKGILPRHFPYAMIYSHISDKTWRGDKSKVRGRGCLICGYCRINIVFFQLIREVMIVLMFLF